MTTAPDAATVFDVLAEVISRVVGVERDRLEPGLPIAELDIDSMYAGEIAAQTEAALDVEIDFRRVAEDWSQLTIGDLATEFLQGARPQEAPAQEARAAQPSQGR